MFKRIFTIALVPIVLMVAFTLMPTGTAANEVLSGYQSTLAYTSSGSLPYNYLSVLDAEDPLLKDVETSAGDSVNYLWVTDDGTPVTLEQTVQTSTFPFRGGVRDGSDHTAGSTYHTGTDFDTAAADTQRIWQVALWSGTVIQAEMNGTDRSYGYTVVIDHGNGFYTRYAHLGYGVGYYEKTPTPMPWEEDYAPGATTTGYEALGVSSLCVEVGDVVQAGDKLGTFGTTGHSSGPHAHIELVLSPTKTPFSGTKYRAGVANILFGGKSLSEIPWYATKARDGSYWADLTTEEVPE